MLVIVASMIMHNVIALNPRMTWMPPITNFDDLPKMLADRREASLGTKEVIRQTKIAKEMGISQPQLSRIETGDADYKSLTAAQMLVMLRGYQLTNSEIIEAARKYDLELPWQFVEQHKADNFFHVAGDGNKALFVGAINGGLKSALASSEKKMISVPGFIAERYNLEEIFVAIVYGDSMADDNVMDQLPCGTECYFHRRIQPENGDIVAVWLEHQEIGVLKIYRPDQGFTVLQSYNKQHAPIIIDENNPGILQGVLVGSSRPQPRFKR